jgi:opacity protein-like surface antigen
MPTRAWTTVSLAAAASLLGGASAAAQTDAGAIVGGAVSAAVAETTSLSLAGTFGYRLNRVIGFGVELVWTPAIERGPDDSDGSIVLPYRFVETESDQLIFTTNVRLEIPTTSRRILPYVIAGGGIASRHDDRRFQPMPLARRSIGAIPTAIPVSFGPIEFETTSTGLALTIGGGASFLVSDHLSVDLDLRHVYIREIPDSTIGRFGGGVSYRF